MPNDSPRDDRIDLSALDLFGDGSSLDARAALIARDAMDARQRLLASQAAERTTIVGALMNYSLQTVVAAGVVLALALSAVARAPMPAASVHQVSAADAMGIPRPLADILHSARTPSLADLGVALDVAGSR